MNSKKRRRAPEIPAALTAKSRRAIELHQQGHLAEAESLYRQILTAMPMLSFAKTESGLTVAEPVPLEDSDDRDGDSRRNRARLLRRRRRRPQVADS